jgi:hypothetical protein
MVANGVRGLVLIYNKETIESIVEKIFSGTTRKIKNECPLYIYLAMSISPEILPVLASFQNGFRAST